MDPGDGLGGDSSPGDSGPDTTAPIVQITFPLDGSLQNRLLMRVTGTIDDPTALLDVNGIAATIDAGLFVADGVPMIEGTNVITATATDAAGNIGTDVVQINLDATPPVITISEPTSLALVQVSSILVRGTINDPSATVTVNDLPAPPSGGAFEVVVPLGDGTNFISAVGTDPAGNVGISVVTIGRDTMPPAVAIESPRHGAQLTSLEIDVAGSVNDLVVGTTIGSDDVTVTVNGLPATVRHRSFTFPGLLLKRGDNNIVVEATDRAGNRREVSHVVEVRDRAGQRIALVSGNSQAADRGALVPQPLVVTLLDANGDPVPNRAVHFEVNRGDGMLVSGDVEARSFDLETDDQGLARVAFRLGQRAGVGNHRVLATAAGFTGEVELCMSVSTGAAAVITAAAGNNQEGLTGQPLAKPIAVQVNDSSGNPVEGAPVTFAVALGTGTVDGQSLVVHDTNSDGEAYASIVLGPEAGIGAHAFTASIAGAVDPVIFIANGLEPSGLQTRVSGIVLDTEQQPLPGTTVIIRGTGLSAVTDSQGTFVIEPAPVGPIVLMVNAATTSRSGSWPTLDFEMETLPGQDNSLGRPIQLPQIDTASTKLVGGAEDVTLTLRDVDGAELTIFANSVTCPDGSSECPVSWSQVSSERVPMPAPRGGRFTVATTLQPPNVRFSPPARICLPNYGAPPGTQQEYFSFDHDLGNWVAIGTATVSDDGAKVCTDAGFGVLKSGWHGPPPPPPPAQCLLKCEDEYECTIDELVLPDCYCTHTEAGDGTPCDNECIFDGTGQCYGRLCIGEDGGQHVDQECDGDICTEGDYCASSSCIPGAPVRDSLQTTEQIQMTLPPFVELVESSVERFADVIGVELEATANIQAEESFQTTCCAERQERDVPKRGRKVTVEVGAEIQNVPIPGAGFSALGFKFGIGLTTLSGGVNGSFGKEVNDCTNEECYTAQLAAYGGAGIGIFAEDPAKVIDAQADISCKLFIGIKASCKDVRLGVTHDDVKGAIRVQLFDGFITGEKAIVLYEAGVLLAPQVTSFE